MGGSRTKEYKVICKEKVRDGRAISRDFDTFNVVVKLLSSVVRAILVISLRSLP